MQKRHLRCWWLKILWLWCTRNPSKCDIVHFIRFRAQLFSTNCYSYIAIGTRCLWNNLSIGKKTWATAWQNQQIGMRTHKSAWSDQRLHCPHEALGPWLFTAYSEDWSCRLGGCSEPSLVCHDIAWNTNYLRYDIWQDYSTTNVYFFSPCISSWPRTHVRIPKIVSYHE